MSGAKACVLDGTDQSHIVAERGPDDPKTAPRRHPRGDVHRAAHGAEQEVSGFDHAPAEHDQLRIEEVDEGSHRDAAVGTRVFEDRRRQLVAGPRRAYNVLRQRVLETVQRAAWCVRRQLARGAADPGPAGDRLQVAPLPACAEGPIRLQHDVADLARDAVGPRLEVTAEQDAGPDAGGYRDVDHLAGPTRGAASMLAQRGEVCVVVEEAGDTGGTGENPIERDIPEAGQVARADDKARRRVDRTRKSDAERP